MESSSLCLSMESPWCMLSTSSRRCFLANQVLVDVSGESLGVCLLICGMLPIVYTLSEGSQYMFVSRDTKLVCCGKAREDIRH